MDQRLLAAGTGAAIGLALVVALGIVHPPSSAGPSGIAGGAGQIETPPPPIPPADLAAAFARPGRSRVAGQPVALTVEPGGNVELPSGRLTLADAFMLGVGNPVAARTFQPGTHPVMLLFARGANVDQAAAALLGTADRVEDWLPVTDTAYAGSETGMVALVAAELDERLATDEVAADALADRLQDALATDVPAHDGWLDVEAVGGMRLHAIATEFGVYAAHWGVDADGATVALLVDFGLLDHRTGG